MSKTNGKIVATKENTVTKDIVRKTQRKNGKQEPTNAFKLAKMLSDKRRKGNPVSRKEIMEKLGFDPAPYAKLYGCFESVDRGQYVYTGEALDEMA